MTPFVAWKYLRRHSQNILETLNFPQSSPVFLWCLKTIITEWVVITFLDLLSYTISNFESFPNIFVCFGIFLIAYSLKEARKKFSRSYKFINKFTFLQAHWKTCGSWILLLLFKMTCSWYKGWNKPHCLIINHRGTVRGVKGVKSNPRF